MGRSKYINTFNTTAEYDTYIDSALPEFPNVGYDKEAGKVKINRTSPNSHAIFGELVTEATNMPYARLVSGNTQVQMYATSDGLGNFYIDGDYKLTETASQIFVANAASVKSIKKLKLINNSSKQNYGSMFRNLSNCEYINANTLNLSLATDIQYVFSGCSSLKVIDITSWDLSNVTMNTNAFYQSSNITDVYIGYESTLNKITNNLASNGGSYVPLSATIHYDNGTGNVDYKWQNNAWTPQS